MSDEKPHLSLKDQLARAKELLQRLRRYRTPAFLVLVAGLYGFLFWRINSLGSTQPTTDAVTSQVQAARIPHIDKTVVNQLKSLQDNSVSVQALFDQARNNPFQ